MTLGRVLILIVGLSGPASADSLADMRQDLADLLYETKRLRLELTATQVGRSQRWGVAGPNGCY